MVTPAAATQATADPGRRAAVRPKLLLLACYFPPVRGSACVRTWNIAKYLARAGWQVTVVTPDPRLWQQVDDPDGVSAALACEGIRRIMTPHRWRFLSPHNMKCSNRGLGRLVGGACRRTARALGIDVAAGWAKDAEQACAGLTREDVDVVLASGPPFSSFPLAKSLSKRLGRPYVVDYRDAWEPWSYTVRPARRAMRRLERKLIAESAAVVGVSPSLVGRLPGASENRHVITNGFDPDELDHIAPHSFGHFAIVYAGIFYPPKRVITPVMAALRMLQTMPDVGQTDWRFHYYGPEGDHIREEARRFCVSNRVVVHGPVSRKEALSAVRGAGVSVVITSIFNHADADDKGIVTGKIFEALGFRVPALVIAPTGSDVEFISKDSGLVDLVQGEDIDRIALSLASIMSGHVPPANRPEVFAWPNVIKNMDRVLRAVADVASS